MLKEKFVKLFDIARLDPKQKLDDTKKLFLEAQRSNKRYGFIDTSASNEEIHQVAMDIDVDDRIAIILSTSNVNQLLGVPKIFDGTAENHAVAILNTLEDWKVTPYIKAMCFDTPAVNTGILNGTAALIERKLNRKLIRLPCRHHIFKIILKGVFEVFWPTTSGPNVPIFGRFKNWWSKADHLKYQSGMEDKFVANALNTDRLEIINR
ncbi:uncharacterized protein LOC124184831 isoform X2 [Neodiprion fabricii]|uniref:uncharacterized protein LOC124184831 isoform X2 n=1 Tax=Neodiprion fabricii TaxID=2872261 RepID=UPI001ED931FC|nr:uncharacterized protein LOC124184831 isoform X2 [Neodiprion fabricii]